MRAYLLPGSIAWVHNGWLDIVLKGIDGLFCVLEHARKHLLL
jgi:hypothetical protein